MDETKETRQDNSSAEDKGSTSTKEPETFTKEQVEEAERKGKSDALSEVGRYKKSAESAIKAAQAAEVRINRMLKEQEDAELETARDDPDKLTGIRARQVERQRKADLDKREQELKASEDEHAEALKAVVKSTKEQNAREIAARLNVEAKTLVKLAKFTDGSLEAIEDIAKDLPKKGEETTLKPDSGKTIGGGASFEKIRDEMIKNPSNDAKMKRYMEAKKAQEG